MATGFDQSSSGSSRRGLPGVLLLSSSALIAGISNGSVGRPAAVQLQAVASGSAAASVVSGRAQVLSVPPGGSLLLQDLLLANATLASPIGNPNTVLLPAGLELPPDALLKLRDVVMVVAQQQLQEYIGFMLSVPQAVLFTDDVSFLHIRNYTNPPFGQVEARSVTLIAPEGARINNVPLGVLRAMQPKANSSSSSSSNIAAAAQGDGAGIVTVTDSYVLGANNATLLPLLRRLGGQETQQPLLVLIESNVTLAPAAWGNAWPQGGLKVQRPTVWAGSSWRATSIDFGMEVGQIVLSGRYSNVTLVNVDAENLAYGNAASSQEAEGNSILLSNQLWAFSYRRSVPRVVLWDTVLVLPQQQQIESIIYWVNAFNSDLDFWRNQTRFLRETLQYTIIQYTRGKLPGDYIIITAFKKDQRINNVTYTSIPSAALPLPLPVDPAIHQPLLSSQQQETVVGTVRRREGLAVTLWNQRRGSCSRPHVLLLTPLASGTIAGSTNSSTAAGVVSFGPAELDLATGASHNAAAAAAADTPAPDTQAAPGSAAAASTQSDWGVRPNTTLLDPLPAADAISTTWPPPGGQIIECPVEMRGAAAAGVSLPGQQPQQQQQQQQQQTVVVDVGYAVNLFRVQPNSEADGAPSSSQIAPSPGNNAAAAAGSHPPLLQLNQLTFKSLPQGPAAALNRSSGTNSVAAAAVQASDKAGDGTDLASAVPGGGSASWQSLLPAEAYTHLLWFVSRNLTSYGSILLANVTLLLPPAEAAQLAAAAASAVAANPSSNADQALLTMVYPTPAGPLAVLYRAIRIGNNSSLAESGKRRLLQAAAAEAAAAAAGAVPTVCVGSMQGVGLSGRDVCFVAQQAGEPLPPGYFWTSGASASSSSSSRWTPGLTAGVILAVLLPLLAAAAALLFVWRRRHQRSRQQQHMAAAMRKKNSDQLPSSIAAGNSVDAESAWGHDKQQQRQLKRPGKLSDSARDVVHGDSSNSRSSRAARAAGAPDAAGDSSSSEGVKASGSSIASRLRDCCPGSSADIIENDKQHHMLLPQAAAATPSAAANPAAAPPPPPPAAAAAAAAGAASSSVVVELGEQLGRLAELHRRQMSISDCEVPDEADNFGVNSLLSSQFGRQQQQQGSTVARLSHAITSVAADMQMRRLAGGTAAASAAGIMVSGSPASQWGLGLGRSSNSSGPLAGSAAAAATEGPLVQAAAAVPPAWPLPESQPDAPATVSLRSRAARLSLSSTNLSATPPAAAAGRLNRSSLTQQQQQLLQLHEVVGSGTFGVVYRATWRGIPAAVKVLQLPAGGIDAFEALQQQQQQNSKLSNSPAGPNAAAAAGFRGYEGLGGARERLAADRRSSRREQMAVMETALGSSLSHPNIVQVYTYVLRPLSAAGAAASFNTRSNTVGGRPNNTSSSSGTPPAAAAASGSCKGPSSGGSAAAAAAQQQVVGYELQLVMEYCPLGSLRSAIDSCLLDDRLTNRPNYSTVLSLGLGVARAMAHLHAEGVIHGDLKAANVLLKMELAGSPGAGTAAAGTVAAAAPNAGGAATCSLSGGSDKQPQPQQQQQQQQAALVAKVADFGLATRLDDTETHVSGVHRGTLTHMAPELLLQGRASKASDVYAFGILLWELATGRRAFLDVPKAMLGAAVVRDAARPDWPEGSSCMQAAAFAAAAAAAAGLPGGADLVHPPMHYRQLTEACWAHNPADRPGFGEVCGALELLLAQEQERSELLAKLLTRCSLQQQQPH